MRALAIWMAFLSVVTFVAYGWDKLQAKRGGSRIPENWLHALALAGGFLGGWIGMYLFHHKVRKRSFKVVLIVATVAWLALAAWWAQ